MHVDITGLFFCSHIVLTCCPQHLDPTPPPPCGLLSLPPELLAQVICHLRDAQDVSSFFRTCRGILDLRDSMNLQADWMQLREPTDVDDFNPPLVACSDNQLPAVPPSYI